MLGEAAGDVIARRWGWKLEGGSTTQAEPAGSDADAQGVGSGRKVQICSQPDSQASHESCSPVLRIPCASIIVPCGKSDVVVEEEEGNLQGSLTKEASAKYAAECKGQVRRKVPCLSAVIGRLESAPAVGRSMCWKKRRVGSTHSWSAAEAYSRGKRPAQAWAVGRSLSPASKLRKAKPGKKARTRARVRWRTPKGHGARESEQGWWEEKRANKRSHVKH